MEVLTELEILQGIVENHSIIDIELLEKLLMYQWGKLEQSIKLYEQIYALDKMPEVNTAQGHSLYEENKKGLSSVQIQELEDMLKFQEFIENVLNTFNIDKGTIMLNQRLGI